MTLAERIVGWVTARYVAELKDSTSQEIADGLGIPVARVRSCMRKYDGCPPGLGCWKVSRTSHSRAYPMMDAGAHRVWSFGPTRKHLAEQLRNCGAWHD